jgi:hypothetical protein
MASSTTTLAKPVSTVSDEPMGEVGCGNGASPRFPMSFLDGPQLTPEEFELTPLGAEMKAFFEDGPGEVEDFVFAPSNGFSIVSDSLVLGYQDVLPDVEVSFESGRVTGWGTCPLVLANGDLIASRWNLAQTLNQEMTAIPIQVDGGACVTDSGQDLLTEVVRIDVEETDDSVEVVTWTRDKPFDGICAGVGVFLDAEVELGSALGDRRLVDGGTIPKTDVSTP